MSLLERLKGVNVLGMHGQGPQPLLNRGSFLFVGRSVLVLENMLPEGDASTEPCSSADHAATLLDNTVAARSFFHQEFSLGFSFLLYTENS